VTQVYVVVYTASTGVNFRFEWFIIFKLQNPPSPWKTWNHIGSQMH